MKKKRRSWKAAVVNTICHEWLNKYITLHRFPFIHSFMGKAETPRKKLSTMCLFRCWLMILLFATNNIFALIHSLRQMIVCSCYISISALTIISTRLSLTWINLLWRAVKSSLIQSQYTRMLSVMNQHELAQLNEKKNHFKNLYPNKNIFVMMKWH